MRQITENGKTYTVSDEGVIIEASVSLPEPAAVVGLELAVPGQRVVAEGRLGRVIAVTDTIYGDAIAVRHDDGSIVEYTASDVSAAEEEPVVYDSELEEVRGRFAAYEALPSITTEEIEAKSAEARLLKLRAEAALRQPNLAMKETIELDSIAMVTGTDLKDLKDLKIDVDRAENEDYLRGTSRHYRLAEDVGSYAPNMGTHGEDASWLDTAIDGMTVSEATDADLAASALHMVAKLDRDKLDDIDYFAQALSFQHDYLGIKGDQEKVAKFAAFAVEARNEELLKPAVVKEAAVEESLDDFNASALYL